MYGYVQMAASSLSSKGYLISKITSFCRCQSNGWQFSRFELEEIV